MPAALARQVDDGDGAESFIVRGVVRVIVIQPSWWAAPGCVEARVYVDAIGVE